MKNEVMITEGELYPRAKKIFIKTCGFDLSRELDQRMMKTGMKVWKKQFHGKKICAIIESFGHAAFNNKSVDLGTGAFTCNIFDEIPDEAVVDVYAFALTAGDHSVSAENMMDYVYADIWGTSYVEAASEIVGEMLAADIPHGCILSQEFGPGYFGIPVENSVKIVEALGGRRVGITVNEAGLLVPQKSCASVYLVFKDFKLKMEKECINCNGNKNSCQFCNVKKVK